MLDKDCSFFSQVLAIKKGLTSVIPEPVLRLLTWNEVERGICGNPEVSLAVLKSACKCLVTPASY
jgi:E3 ubiquitin-protein ligase HECTD3